MYMCVYIYIYIYIYTYTYMFMYGWALRHISFSIPTNTDISKPDNIIGR